MKYQQQIAELIYKVISQPPFSQSLTVTEIENLIEVPKDSKMGDFAFPCFSLAKAFKKAPPMIAKDLVTLVKERALGDSSIKDVEAAGPYLNFKINKALLAEGLIPKILDGSFLQSRFSKKTRVMIEYSQPNTHKAFHVGHTRNVALGDSLVRLYEWAGYDVVAANYIGDEGAHIAKCLWLFKDFKGEVPKENKGEFLGGFYAKAVEQLDFTLLTRAPHPNVISAKVEKVEPHPKKPEWKVVTVNTGAETKVVVCGGQGFKTGDVVAYAKNGARINGRLVGRVSKEGIESEGMICSESEVSQGENENKIYVLPSRAPLGLEISEMMRVPGALPPNVKVVDEMNRREGEVAEVLKAIENMKGPLSELWQTTRQWSLDEFTEIYKWLDVRFDHIFYESEVAKESKDNVMEFFHKGVFVKSEGAIGADLSKYNLPFFLLIRSNGTGLYSTKDISLAQKKFRDFKIDRSIYVVDVAQSLHFQQVFKALEMMGYEQAKKCFHLPYGMVVLPDGKMSSRKGNVIYFSQLKETLIKKLREEFLDKYQTVSEENEEVWPEQEIIEAAKRLAIATIKYGMLNQDNQKNIVFDLTEWTAKTGNTGPYLMYAYARTRSILRELGKELKPYDANYTLLTHETESELLTKLSLFPEVVERAAETYQPQQLCIYLYELSKDFNRFYTQCSILRAENEELQMARATLVDAFGRVIQKGLSLLGIKTLDRM